MALYMGLKYSDGCPAQKTIPRKIMGGFWFLPTPLENVI